MKKLSKIVRIWRAVKKKLTAAVRKTPRKARKARKIKACCDCGAVGTTKYCAACAKLRKKEYHQAYDKRRRAKIVDTRPPKKCTGCGEELLGYNRYANSCHECVKKQSAASSLLWKKTPAGRASILAYRKKYNRTPAVRAKIKARERTPEMIAYRKAYYQRPEVIARRKARMSTPEGKEQQRRATLKYQAKKKKMEEASNAQGDRNDD